MNPLVGTRHIRGGKIQTSEDPAHDDEGQRSAPGTDDSPSRSRPRPKADSTVQVEIPAPWESVKRGLVHTDGCAFG